MRGLLYKLIIAIFHFSAIIFSAYGQPIELGKGEKVEYTLNIEFNKQAIENNAFLRFKVDYDKNALNVRFSQGVFKGEELKIEAKEYKKLDKNGNEGLILLITPTKRIKEGTYNFDLKLSGKSPGLELTDSLNLHIDKILVLPEPPMPLWVKIAYFVIGLITLCLIWIFLVKRILFPIFERGEIQVPDNPLAEKFAGYKKIYLGKQANVKNNLLRTLFIGKDGHFLKDLDFSGEINPQKYKGKTWGILKITSPDTNINQQGRMYNYNPDTNDGIYILSKQGNEFAVFNYLNVQNQRQMI